MARTLQFAASIYTFAESEQVGDRTTVENPDLALVDAVFVRANQIRLTISSARHF